MKLHHYPTAILTGQRARTLLALLFVSMNASAEVRFSGLGEHLEENVRALSPLVTTDCDAARWRVERLFREADRTIGEALRALGYYESATTKQLSWSDDCWLAEFEINAGEPVRYRDVDIVVNGAAKDDAGFMRRIADNRPAVGAVFNHGHYSNFKSRLQRAALNGGYFDAVFDTSVVNVDKEARAADLALVFSTGEKYRFGELTFSEGILRDYVLRGYTDIRAGEPYSAQAISDLYESLGGSSYFESVAVKTEPLNEAEKTVPVNVALTPAKRRVYSVGAGFTTDRGPHGRIGYTDRRINDRGHQFDSRLFGSAVESELSATYRWPKRDPRREWFSIVTGFQHEDTETSEHDAFKLGFQRSKNVGAGWLQTRYVDYTYEDFTVADQSSTSQLVIVGTNWEKATGRALSRVTSGYRLSLDLRGASDSLGSDTSFAQMRAKAKWVHSFGEKSRFLARMSVGATSKDSLTDLPASVRFFAGGDSSVRGYEFEALGPVNSDGDVIGGSHQVDASLEVDRLFRDQWAVAIFVDAGDAFNDTDIDVRTGVGLGLRWYSPVGPVRLDLAHPLDNPDEDLRIHISLGPDL